MIRHTILFKLKPDVTKRAVEKIFMDLLDLTNQLEGVNAITGGTCHFHSTGKTLFTHGFSIDFDNVYSRDTFMADPITWPMKEQIAELAEGGIDGIIGFDFRE